MGRGRREGSGSMIFFIASVFHSVVVVGYKQIIYRLRLQQCYCGQRPHLYEVLVLVSNTAAHFILPLTADSNKDLKCFGGALYH